MPRDLEPTPERVAVARRMADLGWSVPNGYPAFAGLEQSHVDLLNAGLAALVIGPSPLGLDYWSLTEEGELWLGRADENPYENVR